MEFIMWIVLIVPIQVMSGQVEHFYLVTNPDYGMEPLNAGRTDRSVLACASDCLNNPEMCGSFLYDNQTGLCIPGSWVTPMTTWPSSMGSLYSRGACDVTSGFQLLKNENYSMCIFVSVQALNYTDAMKACKEKGSRLVTVKSEDKLILLHQVLNADTSSYWVGLSDMEQTGIFRWNDNGLPMDEALQSVIFYPTEPNHYQGKEWCVMWYNPSYSPLGDAQCSYVTRYACEVL